MSILQLRDPNTGKFIPIPCFIGKQGVQGEVGARGARGKSAYEHAKDGGYEGTESEFNAEMAREVIIIRNGKEMLGVEKE